MRHLAYHSNRYKVKDGFPRYERGVTPGGMGASNERPLIAGLGPFPAPRHGERSAFHIPRHLEFGVSGPGHRSRSLLHPKLRDAAPRSYGPTCFTGNEPNCVVVSRVEWLPVPAAVARDIGARRAGGDPDFAVAEPRHGGPEAFGWRARGHGPGFAAIGGRGDIASLLAGLGVIAADGDAVPRIGEGQ